MRRRTGWCCSDGGCGACPYWPPRGCAAINGGQVQVINLHVVERHVDLFASHEAELVPTLVGLTVTETARAMSVWRARADALNEGPAPRDPVCEATLSRTLDDRGVLHASLDAEGVALATAALNIADSHNLDVPACQRRGQALKDVLRWFLDHQDIKTTGRKRPHLNISIVGDTIHTDHVEGFDIETGVRFDSATLRRYLCDCEFHRLLLSAEGVVLDYGRVVKDPPVELYNAVVARDQKCRGYGCDRPASWCHAHHVKWWDRDHGTTEINNLVLLCARCHGVVHRKASTPSCTPTANSTSPPLGDRPEPPIRPARDHQPNSTGPNEDAPPSTTRPGTRPTNPYPTANKNAPTSSPASKPTSPPKQRAPVGEAEDRPVM
jgi:hypothetical protein